jgi:hypothetical protein
MKKSIEEILNKKVLTNSEVCLIINRCRQAGYDITEEVTDYSGYILMDSAAAAKGSAWLRKFFKSNGKIRKDCEFLEQFKEIIFSDNTNFYFCGVYETSNGRTSNFFPIWECSADNFFPIADIGGSFRYVATGGKNLADRIVII